MPRSFALALYLAFARLPIRRGSVEALALPLPRGFTGRTVWLHVDRMDDNAPVIDMMHRFLQENPDWRCVVTVRSVDSAPVDLPDNMFCQPYGTDRIAPAQAFLDSWNPDLGVWAGNVLLPALIHCAGNRRMPFIFVNAQSPSHRFQLWRVSWRIVASLMGRFDFIFAQDKATRRQLRAIGVPANRLAISGPLREDPVPLPCDDLERKKLALAIDGRSVWLLARPDPDELEVLFACFRKVRRSFPELLLIISPRDVAQGDAITALGREDGCVAAQRSKGQKIDARVDVYIADMPNEMGVWYRLAPVSFMGGSLVGTGGINPFDAATLGSAVLRGPHVVAFGSAFDMLAKADAIVAVNDVDDLADALARTLVPERAAMLATAAWRASSEGAEVTDSMLEFLQVRILSEAC